MSKDRDGRVGELDITVSRSVDFGRAAFASPPGVDPSGPAANYEQRLDRSWHAYIFELSTPIIHTGNFTEVIQGNGFRVYPPFNIGKGRSPFVAEDCAFVPDGNPETDWYEKFDYRSANALTVYPPGTQREGVFRAYGLRIDARNIGYALFVYRRILNLVRCHTLQWWLLGALNPFDVKLRFYSDLDQRSRFLHRNQPDGHEVALAGRYPVAGAVRLLGVEFPLDNTIWISVRDAAIESFRTPLTNSLFCDALEKYFQADDNAAILSLAIYLDAAEAEERQRVGIGSKKNAKRDLRKNPQILRYGNAEILKKLFVDRDNIAHAKSPVYANRSSEGLMNRYVTECLKIFLFLQRQRGVISELEFL
jgi:hypothetical protein